ncbi:hypothetical protein ACHAO9_011781 [Fusarium lateritium]
MNANDIGSVARLGLSLASCLEFHHEGYHKSCRVLPKLIAVVNSTALTLGKIQHLIQKNGQVFTEAGVNEIESLTTTCGKIYNGILIMLVQHTRSVKGDKDVTSLSEEQAETILAGFTNTTIWSDESWDWLQLRLKYCHHLLTQVKFELMMRYLMGCIANHQLSTNDRAPGDFDTELSLVIHAGHVATRWRGHHNHISGKMAIWDKVDSPAPTAKSSLEDIGVTAVSTGEPEIAPSKPCSPTTTVCDWKPVESITPIEAKGSGPTADVEVAAEASQDEPTDDKALDKQEETLASILKSWIKRVLLRGARDVWKDQDLEVWQVDMSVQSLIASNRCRKLDIDDRQIRSTLASLPSRRSWRKRPQLIEQYASLDQRVRQRIDEAIDAAHTSSPRERSWIAMSTVNGPFQRQGVKGTRVIIQPEVSISLFFRLGREMECIYVRDTTGTMNCFPYASCKTIPMLRDLVTKANWDESIKSHIKEGRYHITFENGFQLSSTTWDSLRCPGMALTIRSGLWPMTVMPPPPPPLPVVNESILARRRKLFQPRPPKMKPIHCEMKDTLQISYPLFPDAAFEMQLGELLKLWTNAIDCIVHPWGDDSSDDWTTSSASSADSSDSAGSTDIAESTGSMDIAD